MIERITKRLNEWAEQAVGGGYAGGTGSPMGAMIDGRTAELSEGRSRRVVELAQVKIYGADGDRFYNQFKSRKALESARGVQSLVSSTRSVNIGDAAMDVADAVAKLPDELREAVCVFYFEGGLAADVRAKRLKISRATMYNRIDVAHIILDYFLYNTALPTVL